MRAPAARIETVRDTYFGVTIDDPYRWMEAWESEEARSWLDAQATYAREFLHALPERDALRTHIGVLSGDSPLLSDFRLAGGRSFYLRRDPGAEAPLLVVRDRPDAVERVLLDPAGMPGESPASIDWYVPAPDGRHVAYGLSRGGSENSTLHVLHVESAATLADTISRVRFWYVSWLEDNRSFVYHRYRDPAAGIAPARRRDDSRSHLHRLGSDPEEDPVVFARGLNARVEMMPRDRPFIVVPPGGAWMIGIVSHGALGGGKWSDCMLCAAPRSGLADPATCLWTKIAGPDDGVTNLAVDGDTLYLATSDATAGDQVLAVPLQAPNPSAARVVVPAGPAMIDDIRVAGDYLLTCEIHGGLGRLRRVALAGGEQDDPEDVVLPGDGTILEWTGEPGATEVVLSLTSWTMPPRLYRYDARSGALEETGWTPPSPVDFSGVVAHETHALAEDGTPIPLSIIHKKGLALDGDNPTLLIAYGAYGHALTPVFQPEMLAWYERGGLFAIAHVRGGGEYGRAWHEAGRKLNKETTITDFIACAEHLIARGYTRPGRLAGAGTSAGGIPAGGALVRRPDLWAAIILRVALTNALRFETSENGPVNVPELGSVTTREGFESLRIIDSYLRVRDGVRYPAVLLMASLNDRRMPVWQATKMAARLQAATASEQPVLLRVDVQSGHRQGVTRARRNNLLADELAFLLHACVI